MKKNSKILSVLLLAFALIISACSGVQEDAGRYTFQIGKEDESHFGVYLILNELGDPFIPTLVGENKDPNASGFSLSARNVFVDDSKKSTQPKLAVTPTSEIPTTSEPDEPIVLDMNMELNIQGNYTFEEKDNKKIINFDVIKIAFIDGEEEIDQEFTKDEAEIMSKLLDTLLFAYKSGDDVHLDICVSIKDWINAIDQNPDNTVHTLDIPLKRDNNYGE